MADNLTARIAALLGEAVAALAPLHGSDLSEVSEVTLASGRRVVAKRGPMAAAEARMLRAIARTGCPAPRVIATDETVFVMEYLEEGARPEWGAVGTGLRKLHAATGAQYGWPEDYAFGPVAIPNAPADDWPAFWAERRLLAAPDALPGDIRTRVERLAARLAGLLPQRPRPALLHGDLWGGNVLHGAGTAWLIDPACYYGDPEVDLAMLHLFGRPGAGFADAYGPLPAGWQGRRPVYQLWPALVHLRLFGPGYRGMVEGLLTACDV